MSRNAVGKLLQLVTAGAGLLVGYLWGVLRWGGFLSAQGPRSVGGVAEGGALVALVYATLLGGLFWSWIPSGERGGIRMVVAPTAFTLSFLLGAVGIQSALWLLR